MICKKTGKKADIFTCMETCPDGPCEDFDADKIIETVKDSGEVVTSDFANLIHHIMDLKKELK